MSHLLENIVQLLQGRSDGSVSADARRVTVEVGVRHPVQSVVPESADHRRTHGSPFPVPEAVAGERRLLVLRRVIFGSLKPWILHQE